MFPWTPACGAQTTSLQTHKSGPAESLYLQLSSIGLESTRVFRVRDSSLDRPAIHITLEDGTIAEVGTHQELLAKCGTYSRLYEMQFADTDDTATPAIGPRPASSREAEG